MNKLEVKLQINSVKGICSKCSILVDFTGFIGSDGKQKIQCKNCGAVFVIQNNYEGKYTKIINERRKTNTLHRNSGKTDTSTLIGNIPPPSIRLKRVGSGLGKKGLGKNIPPAMVKKGSLELFSSKGKRGK